MNALGDLQLAHGGLRHAGLWILVDGQCHTSSAILFQKWTDAIHPLFAILQIDRIDDATPRRVLQSSLEYIRLRRIDHQRRIHLPHKSRDRFGHITYAISADEINTDIQDMRTIAKFFLGHRCEPVPIFRVQKCLEFF